MPDPVSDESHLSAQAAFIVGLPRRKQRVALDLAEQLARNRFRVSDYRMPDMTGRDLANLLIEGFLFTYWVDHAAKEVRITEIVKL